jgi:hypothetical protein
MIGANGPCMCDRPAPSAPAKASDVDGCCATCGGYFAICGRCLEPLNNGRSHGLGHCSVPEGREHVFDG